MSKARNGLRAILYFEYTERLTRKNLKIELVTSGTSDRACRSHSITGKFNRQISNKLMTDSKQLSKIMKTQNTKQHSEN